MTLSDLCDDVLLVICDHLDSMRSETETPRKCLSLTSRRFRQLLAPGLFKTLHINTPIKLLANNQLHHFHAQTLRIDMFGSLWWWCSGLYVSADDVIDLFNLIHKLPNLRCLEVSMMGRSIDLFEAAFCETMHAEHFSLQSVEKLVVTNSAAFLTRNCPNLKSLVIQDGGECLIEAYSRLTARLDPEIPLYMAGQLPSSTLTRLDGIAMWDASELIYVIDKFPKLTFLAMRSDTYCYRAPICSISELLGKGLKNLNTLHLSKIGHLDMGYRSVWKRRIQECKTEEHRRRLWQENEALRVQAENSVARLAFGAIDSLLECWLGDKRVARKIADSEVTDSFSKKVAAKKWIWSRQHEDIDVCSTGSEWAKYRAEREAVVQATEMGA